MAEYKFPDDFLFGVSISSYQTEGNNFYSDWYAWEKLGKIKDGSTSGIACDFYHRYQEDIDLAKKLNLDAFRLSIEWSRIEQKEGVFDSQEIEHYRQVLKYLKGKKFKVFLTLWHFTLPSWLARKRGWENKKTIFYFTRYLKKIVQEFSSLVDFWLTFNEPNIYLGSAYLVGVWPPEKKNFIKAVKVFFNLVKAHRKAYQIIHQILPQAKVGLANNFIFFRGKGFFNKIFAHFFNFFYNHLFYFFTKSYHDFIGLNYYTSHRVKIFQIYHLFKKMTFGIVPKEAYAPGIYFLLKDLTSYKLPIYITENGIADKTDSRRRRFIIRHLKWIWQAIKEKINVKGYLHWSLIDNFEWRDGFKPCFGLIEINYNTLERKLRLSALMYATIAQDKSLKSEIVNQYAPEIIKEICG